MQKGPLVLVPLLYMPGLHDGNIRYAWAALVSGVSTFAVMKTTLESLSGPALVRELTLRLHWPERKYENG
jgi:hypothetical protein